LQIEDLTYMISDLPHSQQTPRRESPALLDIASQILHSGDCALDTSVKFGGVSTMKVTVVSWLLAVVCVPTLSRAASNPELRPLATSVAQYARIEFDIAVDTQYTRPFDPREVDLSLVITTPSGVQLRVPAFYWQPYERKELAGGSKPVVWIYLSGLPGWRAGFTPSEAGQYSAVAELTERDGTRRSSPAVFTCQPAEAKGFVRVSRSDPRYYEFSNGQPFFPIGQNLAFIGDSQYITPAKVADTFEKLSHHGANYLRIWTCCHDWAMAIEARKSAWGRTWAWKPPFAPLPDGDDPEQKCLRLSTDTRASVELEPCYPVALRPQTDYVLFGRARLEPSARLLVKAGDYALAQPVSMAGDTWQPFTLPFRTADDQYWLGRTELRVTGEGSAWIDGLSLREAAGGPELLWEAAVNRPERGYYNPIDCALLDHLVQTAEQHDIYLQLCLITRDLYMSAFKNEQSSEYAQAIVDAQNLLRYAVARWGYSTHIVTWEYFNENDPGLPMERFYREVGDYLGKTDVYHHLRSTSAWNRCARDCQSPDLDVADVHFYLRSVEPRPYADEVEAALGNAAWLREQAPAKPALIGEFGLADAQWRETPEMRKSLEIVDFHNAIWASALSGTSGTALFWWWDRLDARDHYRHYRPLADFLADVPWTTAHLQQTTATASGRAVRLVGLQGEDRAYLWLFDPQASWDNVVIRQHKPEAQGGVQLAVPGLKAGTYRVQWWDTRTGKTIQQDDVQVRDAPLRAEAPQWQCDIACKITPLP
jgi:hypothetical protein